MPTISALLQPTSEVKAIVSRLSGLGKLSSYIDFIKQKNEKNKNHNSMHESSIELHLEISRHLLSLPLGQGPDVYVEQNQCCYISWDTVAYQKYLLKSHWSRIKTEAARLRSACNTSKENNTHSPRVQLPSSRNLYKEFYRLCFLIVKVFSWECIPMFSRES